MEVGELTALAVLGVVGESVPVVVDPVEAVSALAPVPLTRAAIVGRKVRCAVAVVVDAVGAAGSWKEEDVEVDSSRDEGEVVPDPYVRDGRAEMERADERRGCGSETSR